MTNVNTMNKVNYHSYIASSLKKCLLMSIFFSCLTVVHAEICEPVAPPAHVIVKSCTLSDVKVDCSAKLVTGSTLTAVCEKGYLQENDATKSSGNVRCSENGKWTDWPFCTEDCGKLGPLTLRPRASVVFTPALRGLFAWHVAIYKLSRSPLPICSGTIISSQMILSAAHCFRDEQKNDKLGLGLGPDDDSIENSVYVIVVAKSTRNYHTKDSEHTRSYKIKKLIFPRNESHSRSPDHFASDIVILVPRTPIKYHKGDVYPACVDWQGLSQSNSENGIEGEVYGWGLSDNTKYSEYLVYVKIPQISANQCKKVISIHKRTTVTPDKVCASSEYGANKVRVCDGGSGLLEWNRASNRYYLRGIVSARNDGQNNSSIISFTNLTSYVHWIRQVKDMISAGDTRPSSEMNDEELDGISIRFGEGNTVANDVHHAMSSTEKRRTTCKLPFRSPTLKYTIVNCGPGADAAICQKRSGDFIEADTGLHVQCLNSKGEFVQFDSYCSRSVWKPSMESCTGRRESTNDRVGNPTTEVPHTATEGYDNLNSDEVFLEILHQLKELLLRKIETVLGIFSFK